MALLDDVIHMCLYILGCGCLDDSFWRSGRQPAVEHAPAAPFSPGQAHLPNVDVRERLLASDSSRDGDQPDETVPSSSEDLVRFASFNTKVTVLRGQSPFYRQQLHSELQQPQASQQPQQQSHPDGIELKNTASNALLGLEHLENRGKFVPAHPVQQPGSMHAVRRGAG